MRQLAPLFFTSWEKVFLKQETDLVSRSLKYEFIADGEKKNLLGSDKEKVFLLVKRM